MKVFAFVLLFAFLFSTASAAHLWAVSGTSAHYLPAPTPRPAISTLDYGHCSGYSYYGTQGCVYYSRQPIVYAYYHSARPVHSYGYDGRLPPGLQLSGFRYQTGRYVPDYYEGYRQYWAP